MTGRIHLALTAGIFILALALACGPPVQVTLGSLGEASCLTPAGLSAYGVADCHALAVAEARVVYVLGVHLDGVELEVREGGADGEPTWFWDEWGRRVGGLAYCPQRWGRARMVVASEDWTRNGLSYEAWKIGKCPEERSPTKEERALIEEAKRGGET